MNYLNYTLENCLILIKEIVLKFTFINMVIQVGDGRTLLMTKNGIIGNGRIIE